MNETAVGTSGASHLPVWPSRPRCARATTSRPTSARALSCRRRYTAVGWHSNEQSGQVNFAT